nr:MAG: hypothetical protein [Narnaviridae sp.]
MAKTKSKKTQNQTGNRKKVGRSRRSVAPPQNNLTARYARLLHNPDNGDHMFDVYDGERGETQKFISTVTLNATAGHNCGFIAFCGATGNYASNTGTLSSTALAWAFTNVGAPGSAFLTANAHKTRCKALKLEMIPSAASFNTITGEVAAGVCTNSVFAVNPSVDQLFDQAKAYGPLRRELVSSRWFPSGLDHTYSLYNVGPNEDQNLVFLAYRGWPNGVPLSIRITYVVEYTVRIAIGIPPTGAVSHPVGHANVLAAMQTSDPHWHHSILDELKGAGTGIARDVGVFARRMAREGMVKIAGQVFNKTAPLLLTM